MKYKFKNIVEKHSKEFLVTLKQCKFKYTHLYCVFGNERFSSVKYQQLCYLRICGCVTEKKYINKQVYKWIICRICAMENGDI